MRQRVTIYHNPRCSKSRQALALLKESSQGVKVVEYLKEPLSAAELQALVKCLALRPHDIVRTKEPEYKDAGLSSSSSDGEVIAALVRDPKLLERPIVVCNGKAVIGRPPEQVLEIL